MYTGSWDRVSSRADGGGSSGSEPPRASPRASSPSRAQTTLIANSQGDSRVIEIPNLDPARIAERANDGSYKRGLDYASRGRIKLLDFVEGNGMRTVTFVAAGSHGAEWKGSITDAGGVFTVMCYCPDKRARWCKHIVGGALCCCASHGATFAAVLPTDADAAATATPATPTGPAAATIDPEVPEAIVPLAAVRTPTRLNATMGPLLVYPLRTVAAGDDTPITFSVTREQYNTIVTPLCRWTPNGGQGELLKGFLTSPLVHEKIGEQWAPAASSRKTICMAGDVLKKRRKRDFDFWRGFGCECPRCPAFLKVGGNFISSDHVGDIIFIVVVATSCEHRLSDIHKGYGTVRGADRASVALAVKGILARTGLHPSAHNSYNAMLRELEEKMSDVLGGQALAAAAAGNHSKTGTIGPRVMRQIIADHTPDLRMDKELFASLDMMSTTKAGIIRYQRKPFVIALQTEFQLEVYHRSAGIPGVGIFIDATGSMVAPLAPHTPAVYNYCMVIPMTSQGLAVKPFVCLEMFTDDNRGVSLATTLEYFRAAERDKYKSNVTVTHANIDCGLNLLFAVLKVYNGESLEDYVYRVDQELRGSIARDFNKIIIHWCDFHCFKAIRTHVNQAITVSVLLETSSLMSKEEVLDLGQDMFKFMKTCVDYETCEHIIEQIRYILGSKVLPPAVLLHSGVILQDATPSCTISSDATAADYFDVATSSSGGHAQISLRGITSKYHPITESRANPWYCPKLLDYYLEHWIPFKVLWADSAFQGTRAPKRKTDSTSEINFGVLKHVEFGKDQRHMRADVYIAKRLEHFEGDAARTRREVQKRDATKHNNNNVGDILAPEGVRVENTGVEQKEAWSPKRPSNRVTFEDVASSTSAKIAYANYRDQRKRKLLNTGSYGDAVNDITSLDKLGVNNQNL